MSSEHPWSGNQQETGHAALAPRGEVKAGGVTLAASGPWEWMKEKRTQGPGTP